jgi:hypothetical protein
MDRPSVPEQRPGSAASEQVRDALAALRRAQMLLEATEKAAEHTRAEKFIDATLAAAEAVLACRVALLEAFKEDGWVPDPSTAAGLDLDELILRIEAR